MLSFFFFCQRREHGNVISKKTCEREGMIKSSYFTTFPSPHLLSPSLLSHSFEVSYLLFLLLDLRGTLRDKLRPLVSFKSRSFPAWIHRTLHMDRFSNEEKLGKLFPNSFSLFFSRYDSLISISSDSKL